jgi:ubiquinol-cytochrome c reductase cytochrome b subunit
MLNKKRNWREELGLTALDYPIPTHANSFWYSLGGITLFCFVVTFITGAILTQFYNPSPAVAHASVRYIAATPGLKLIRGAYRPPRTITYLLGVALLFVAFQLFFTGTVLKWDQEGYEAMAHFVAVNKLLGPLGDVFQEDFTLSTSMLARIYGLHVGVFSSLLVVLIVLHALLVKHLGIAPKAYQSDEDYQVSLGAGETFTKHLKGLAVYSLILLVVIFFFPPGMLKPPQPGVEMTKPPWPFWVFYPIESALGMVGILLGSVVVSFGLILIPILGMTIGEERKLFRVVNTVVVVGLIAWLALMVITYFSPVMQHL